MKLKFDVSWDSETRRWGASFTPQELWRSASVLMYVLGAVRRDPTIPRLAIDRTRLAIDGRLHTDAILNTEPFKAWYGAGHVLACEAFGDEAKRKAWTLLTAEDFIRFVEWVLALDPLAAEDDLPVSCEIDLVTDGPTARDEFLGLRDSIGNERDPFEDDMYPARGDLTIPELPHDPGSDGPTIGPLWVGQQNARLGENGQLDPIRLRCQPADPHADPPVPGSGYSPPDQYGVIQVVAFDGTPSGNPTLGRMQWFNGTQWQTDTAPRAFLPQDWSAEKARLEIDIAFMSATPVPDDRTRWTSTATTGMPLEGRYNTDGTGWSAVSPIYTRSDTP